MSMFVLIYGVLFSLNFISYECEGKIVSPPDGTKLTFLPGSNETITWKFDDVESNVESRTWSFSGSAGGAGELTLASIIATFDPQLLKENLPEFDIEKPATLVLSNVNQSYDGTYRFSLKMKNVKVDTSDVRVYIADKASLNDSGCGTGWHIVVSLVFGIIIGILVSYIVWCSHRRWFTGSRNPERNSEPQTTEVDTTYQELDLTKMNKEDNYQSLRVNAASNDDDSTYTELSKTRDVENNYQSLT